MLISYRGSDEGRIFDDCGLGTYANISMQEHGGQRTKVLNRQITTQFADFGHAL